MTNKLTGSKLTGTNETLFSFVQKSNLSQGYWTINLTILLLLALLFRLKNKGITAIVTILTDEQSSISSTSAIQQSLKAIVESRLQTTAPGVIVNSNSITRFG